MNRNSTDIALHEELAALCTELRSVLELEFTAINERDSDRLQSLLSEKTRLLNELQNNDAYLAELFAQSNETTSVAQLKGTLTMCRELNSRNRLVAQVELKQTNKSIEYLRSLLKMDDLPLYQASGELTVNREKRNLGVI